jgi:chaperonin cofactor prefoldin
MPTDKEVIQALKNKVRELDDKNDMLALRIGYLELQKTEILKQMQNINYEIQEYERNIENLEREMQCDT